MLSIARKLRAKAILGTRGYVALSPHHSIYVSNSTNPYFNLSLEDWLFRHKPAKEPLLLLYRDQPCVVIGRNQNPWKEVNLPASRRTGIPFIRRRSGGGTVYHDLGNTNFSIHLPRTSFDRNATAQVVLSAVRSLNVDAHVNDRNDVCVGQYKVSGSAYKIVNNRAYHHGTMLISTRLDLLGDLLHSNKDTLHTKGVASVPSPVCNLQQFNPTIDHADFVQSVVSAFRLEYNINEKVFYVEDDHVASDIQYIRHGMNELPSWDWAYGQTPEFNYEIRHTFAWGELLANVHSKHGVILSCTFTTPDTTPRELAQQLKALSNELAQQNYGFVEEGSLGVDLQGNEALREIWQWLRAEMDS